MNTCRQAQSFFGNSVDATLQHVVDVLYERRDVYQAKQRLEGRRQMLWDVMRELALDPSWALERPSSGGYLSDADTEPFVAYHPADPAWNPFELCTVENYEPTTPAYSPTSLDFVPEFMPAPVLC